MLLFSLSFFYKCRLNVKNNNYFNNMFLSSMTQKTNPKNSTLSQPLLNLNKKKKPKKKKKKNKKNEN